MAVVTRVGTIGPDGIVGADEDDALPPPPPPNPYLAYAPNFYVPGAPKAREHFPMVPQQFGTPQPMVHPNIPTPTPEMLMARYYPSGFYDGDPFNDKLKYEYARAAHAEDYYWMMRARHTNTQDMMTAMRSPNFLSTIPRLQYGVANYNPFQNDRNTGQGGGDDGNDGSGNAPPIVFSPGEFIKGIAKPLFKLK